MTLVTVVTINNFLLFNLYYNICDSYDYCIDVVSLAFSSVFRNFYSYNVCIDFYAQMILKESRWLQ